MAKTARKKRPSPQPRASSRRSKQYVYFFGNGKADGDTLEFDIQPGDDAPLIHVKLKLEGDALRGTVKGEADGNTVEGTLELKREK